MKTPLLLLLILFSLHLTVPAQQLLWESATLHANAVSSETAENVQPYGPNRLMLTGVFAPQRTPSSSTCQPLFQAYYQLYDLNGTLVREKLGRNLGNGESDFQLAAKGGGWWTAPGVSCSGRTSNSRSYVQRITARGDTGRAWPLVLSSPPRTAARAVIEKRDKLYIAGYVNLAQSGQTQQFTLTCTDTSGTVNWHYAYPRQPISMDYASGMTTTSKGGFLLSGDGFDLATNGYGHYVLETDSMGHFHRQRLFHPFTLSDGIRQGNACNLLTLPNYGGYLLSGTADSVVGGTVLKHVGYVMRLDTALQVQWTYRHPPQLGGTNAGGNYAYRLRMLPNNTVGILFSDVRFSGTPVTFLVQLDVASGHRQTMYTLVSNTQSVVIPYDWQWLGDGTLLVAGKSSNTGPNYLNSYVARWDFRGTPLATGLGTRPGQHGRLVAYPNPATEQVSFAFAGLSKAPARLQVLELSTGRLVGEQAVAASEELRLSVEQLPSGVYAARLLSKDAQVLGTTKLVVVH